MKNFSKKLSLQWRLTLVITLLVSVTCILMYFFISRSAVTGMENLENYIVQVDETGSEPITFHVDPAVLFPDLSDQVQSTKDLFRIRSIIATGIIILLSSIGTYFISRHALSPLHELSTKIEKIQAQNLSESLEIPESNDAISHLTASFNEMLSRLDDAFTAQKQFSASAAHELRTPLAVMQTNLEVFARKKEPSTEEYREIFSMVQEQTGRLSHLAEVLLDMTGIQTVERSETISLAELTEEVFCDLASVAEQKQIELIQRDGDCTVTGSYLLLYRAVYNLVENAIKYNHSSGKVTVNIHPGKAVLAAASQPHPADCAFVEISDTGIGIPPEYQEKIFAPFFRVDKSRSRAMGGAGLGLALVTEIARQHGGQVKVLESNAKGSTIALMLPIK
ncbi:sensor histidine kinase [Blautia sp. MSJ-19]|uniref:sensor histidine kinase n=1 Tax=Blautia sp. MSJ-19 TaxID=2841517 RepID=UPI001C0E9165|nr:ATP-binding protein [Blautia sp. MSJ-19]MBU5482022.1 HAMP domain-containing protein [Blautia sp. MSJ-19]